MNWVCAWLHVLALKKQKQQTTSYNFRGRSSAAASLSFSMSGNLLFTIADIHVYVFTSRTLELNYQQLSLLDVN